LAGLAGSARHSLKAHENHETPFMKDPYGLSLRTRMMGCVDRRFVHGSRRQSMKWETPEAIDMRFGMEITMYISNR
jgi:coenzyme PQQ precursor peptide PqqA